MWTVVAPLVAAGWWATLTGCTNYHGASPAQHAWAARYKLAAEGGLNSSIARTRRWELSNAYSSGWES